MSILKKFVSLYSSRYDWLTWYKDATKNKTKTNNLKNNIKNLLRTPYNYQKPISLDKINHLVIEDINANLILNSWRYSLLLLECILCAISVVIAFLTNSLWVLVALLPYLFIFQSLVLYEKSKASKIIGKFYNLIIPKYVSKTTNYIETGFGAISVVLLILLLSGLISTKVMAFPLIILSWIFAFAVEWSFTYELEKVQTSK